MQLIRREETLQTKIVTQLAGGEAGVPMPADPELDKMSEEPTPRASAARRSSYHGTF